MPESPNSPRRLPENPSEEHLRKEAKRFARDYDLRLAQAQHRLALDYGHHSWNELIKAVRTLSQPSSERLPCVDNASVAATSLKWLDRVRRIFNL